MHAVTGSYIVWKALLYYVLLHYMYNEIVVFKLNLIREDCTAYAYVST